MSDSLLKQINDQNDLMAKLIESDGELTEDMEKALATLETSVPAKLDSYYLIMERLEAEAEYFKSRAEEFSMAAKQMTAARDRLKKNIKFAMENSGVAELAGNDYRFTLSKSKPRLIIQDELVPDDYKVEVVTIEIEKDRIADHLREGLVIPGCRFEPVMSFRSSVNKKLLKGKK